MTFRCSVGSASLIWVPSSSSTISCIRAEEILLSVARWIRSPTTSGDFRDARIPRATQSTGIRLSSAEGSAGKMVAIQAMSPTWDRWSQLPSRSRIACWARPKRFTGAFTTLVSPRLLPLSSCPMTMAGQSCTTGTSSSNMKRWASSDAMAFVSS